MPKPFNISKDKIIENLKFVKNNQNSISLEYIILSYEDIKKFTLNDKKVGNEDLKFELMKIDIKDKLIHIYPRYLNPDSINFLSKKYHVESITLKGDHFFKKMSSSSLSSLCLPPPLSLLLLLS